MSPFFAQIAFVENDAGNWNVINTKGEILPIKMDSVVVVKESVLNDYKEFGLNVRKGYMDTVYTEFIEYTIYSDGEKVKLVAFNNQYALLNDTTDTRLITTRESKIPVESLKPIFNSVGH